MKKYTLQILILVLSILISILFYRYLPDSMASHWNGEGIVDGYSSKLFNVLFFPLLNIFLFILFIYIPKIDPKWKSIRLFEGKFNLFISSMFVFMVLLQLNVYLWNIGIMIPMGVVMPILMGGLFIVVSVLVKGCLSAIFTSPEQHSNISILGSDFPVVISKLLIDLSPAFAQLEYLFELK